MKVSSRERQPSGGEASACERDGGSPACVAQGPVSDVEASLRTLITSIVREEMAKARDEVGGADDYLSTGAAGALAMVAPGTIRRWVREGRLRGHRAGRVLRVRRSDLEQMFAGCTPPRRVNAQPTPEELARRDFG